MGFLMTLIVLEEAINEVLKDADKKSFADLIRECRDAVGLKSYRVAEFVGIAPARLKNLETGYFRAMPSDAELIAFSRLYDLKYNFLFEKAIEHVREHRRAKKIRTLRSTMLSVRGDEKRA